MRNQSPKVLGSRAAKLKGVVVGDRVDKDGIGHQCDQYIETIKKRELGV
jgi:hypothetical protein